MIRLIGELPEGLTVEKSNSDYIREWREAIEAKRSLIEDYFVGVKSGVTVRVELEVDDDRSDGDEGDEEESVTILRELASEIRRLSTPILFVTTKELILFDSGEKRRGVAIEYPSIILHSLITKPTLQVYLQVSVDSIERDGSRLMLQNEGDDECFIEVTFEGDDCERIYESLCECSTLHPSSNEEVETEAESEVETEAGTETGTEAEAGRSEEEIERSSDDGRGNKKIPRFEDQEE